MLKKLLSVMLAALIAVSPMAAFAEEESQTPEVPVETETVLPDEDFNDGAIAEAWAADKGNAEFSGNDYGYLKFTADAEDATLTRELGITEGEFTVDFRVKAEGTTGTATVSVGGADIALDFEAKTATINGIAADFIPTLWYDVRVVGDGANARVYLDAIKVADVAVTYANEFKVTLAAETAIGIDDFVVYSEDKGTSALKSTPLDFKFDGFEFVNNSVNDTDNAVAPTIKTERTKLDKVEKFTYSVQGTAPVFGTNFINSAGIRTVKGKFGKSKDDKSAYINHKGVSSNQLKTYDSTIDFNVGLNGLLPSSGDKQVISFNLAFDGDVPDDLVVRTYNIYELGSGSNFLGGKAGATKEVAGQAGQVMRIVGESMYLFGNTKYYSIRPALLPNQWNNIRLEMESGTAKINASSETAVAMKISAYVNDMVVAKDVEIKSSEYYVRNQGSDAATRGRFKGIHHLQMNYNWVDGYNTSNGLYLDDVKIENYYSGAEYENVDSPIVWNEKGSLSLDRFAETSTGWTPYRNDRWVQGNIVYVNREMTLGEYKESLMASRNLGVIFRDEEGNELSDLNQKIGDLAYAEITRTDYSKIYVSLIGKTTEITEFALDGDEAFDTSWDVNGVVNNTIGAWDADGDSSSDWGVDGGDDNAVVSEEAFAGKLDGDKVLKIAAASDGTEKKTKFSFFRKNGSVPKTGTPTVYTKADYFRPITFEGSVLIPSEGSSLNIKTVNMLGSYNSYVYGRNSQTNHNVSSTYSLIHFKDGYITARTPYGENNSLTLGKYNVGEWNKIAFTVHPGYGRYRIDVTVNGKETEEYIYISTGGNVSHQAIVWLMLNTVGDVYIDDFKAITGYYEHRDGSYAVTLPEVNTEKLSADGESIVLKKQATCEDLTNALASLGTFRVYNDNTYTSINEGNISTDNVIVAQNDKKVIEYFTVKEREISVTEADGIYTAETFASDKEAVLVAAQYGDEGLVNVKISEKPDANGKLSIRFEKDETAEVRKVFLFGNLLTMVPEMPFAEVSVEAE